SWYSGYINSLKYVIINTLISISVALPAAYNFSRYRFLGDKHLFFWLLSNRMAPAAVYALPFFNLYSAINLFDTPWAVALAHCIFNVPLAVWILEGFVSSVPTAIFFAALASTLGVMTWLAVAYPEAERVGVLRIPTTRGDRLFISLVLAAVIHLLWIAFMGTDPIATLPIGEGVEISSLWLATLISLGAAVAIFRTV